jgi:hypothetical protein
MSALLIARARHDYRHPRIHSFDHNQRAAARIGSNTRPRGFAREALVASCSTLLRFVVRVLRERELPSRQNFLTPLPLMDAHRNVFLHHHWLRLGLHR